MLVEWPGGEANNLVGPEPVVEQEGEEYPVAPNHEPTPLWYIREEAFPGMGISHLLPGSGPASPADPMPASTRPRPGSPEMVPTTSRERATFPFVTSRLP